MAAQASSFSNGSQFELYHCYSMHD